MKYISGNLDNSSRDTIKNALAGGTGEAIEKKLPHIMTGNDENSDYLGECIFKLHYDISDAGTYTLFLNNILPKEVFLDSEEIDPSENIQSLTPGEHIVEVYSSRYWEEINEVLFDDLPGLKKIELPRPLKRFGPISIQNCPNLETLVFGKNVRDLIYPEGGGYFLNCPSLNKIQINKRNKNIILKEGKYIFSKNGEFLLSPDGTLPTREIKSLQKGWTGKTTFNDLVIPNSIETLGEGVFEGCTFTSSLTLGEGLKTIEKKAFYNINIANLDTLILEPLVPPVIESPEYFDLRDLDENGNQISGVEFEVLGNLVGYQSSDIWNNYFSFLNNTNYFLSAVNQYLTFIALEDGIFTFTIQHNNYGNSPQVTSISFSTDEGNTWTTTNYNSSGNTVITTPKINGGKKVIWKGIATSLYGDGGPGAYSNFSSSGKFNVAGNIISLYSTSNIPNNTKYPNLFRECNNLISAKNLVLPESTSNFCYGSMFYECTSLVTAPKNLPGTTATNSHKNMFSGCTSLTTAPALPATTLAEYCYENMFYGCTSLTTAPELPATTLASACYSNMFRNCTSLTQAPELPATTLETYCYASMFQGCTSLTDAPELPATTLAPLCYAYAPWGSNWGGMFYGCTSLVNAPSLPATTLASSCYKYMFSWCTSLTTAPTLPATTLVDECYSNMFSNCSNLSYIKVMGLNSYSNGKSCVSSWLNGVASTGTAVLNSAAEGGARYGFGIPSGWTVQTASS